MDLPQDDAEGDALRELGVQQDIAESRPSSEGATKPETPAPPAEAPEPPQPRPGYPDSEPEPTTPEPQPQPAGRERDEQGRFKAGQQQPQENRQAPEPQQPRSPYSQAREKEAKEQVRRDRSWRALTAERDNFRAQQAQWEEARRVEALQAYAQEPRLERQGIDINGYHKAYLDFRQTGDTERALQALETVLELENEGKTGMQQRQEAQYELAWRRDMEGALGSIPQLQDPGNPLTIETDRIINEHPYLFYIPQGFNKAVEIASLLLGAGSDSELREENDRLRARIEELEGSSQPARGGPGKPPQGRPTRTEDMTMEEEETYLRDLTRREDAMMGR